MFTMNPYDHKKIEKKWQKYWESKKLNIAKENTKKKKFYALIEFPYPSGVGLHVGHIRSNTAMDIISRKRRREGYEVLYPIGWDAFGLPTENYAIKTGIQPATVTKKNTGIFREQLKALGFSFDWSREIDTTDPKYYKWTQWIFLQFLKKGLAYKKKMTINWCPKDLIGLANEEVVDGCCERCGTKVEKKEKEQWMLAITKYAERLDKDLDDTEFLEKIKIQQRNWIGKSEGAEIEFSVKNSDKKIKVFTTRADTLFGVTYIVLAPEHSLVKELMNSISNKNEVEKYIKNIKDKSDIERTDESKEKTGTQLKGIKAINPVNNEEIPVWIADYVLLDYGTGAVMAVPAHDERDGEFAKKYGLDIKNVIAPYFLDTTENSKPRENVETKDRLIGVGIIKHWLEDKYIMLDWKNGWTSFITGGVEKGENVEEAMKREIKEETGYTNVKIIKHLGGPHIGDFYAPHKKLNQHVETNCMYLELIDDSQVSVTDEEKAKHTVVWKKKDEIMSFLKKGNPMGDSRYSEMFWERLNTGNYTWTGEGKLINSGKFNYKDSELAKREIIEFVHGKLVTKFKLRDWIFSRQRYWGEPIPVVHCDKCGIVPVPEKDLPIKLPKVKNYQPTETGESPLANIDKWVNTKCPKCNGKAKRETDTMPNWAGSSWYYLRYTDPKNKKVFADPKKLKYWTPVDWYNGGMEHTTLHLLYSRFWHKFLFDLGLVPTSEPYKKRTSHGMILAEGGEKMSKSVGNVINPDDIIKNVGADSLRIHEMFMGPFDQAIAWDSNSIAGSRRFIEKVWKLKEKIGKNSNESIEVLIHKTIKKVGEDIEEMRFNTAISSMMILVNELEKTSEISKENYEILLQLLSPFAPHVTEELWSMLRNKKSIHLSPWPKYDENKFVKNVVDIMIQINGKVRGSLKCPVNTSDSDIQNTATQSPEIKKWIEGKVIKKVIIIKGKLINIVI